MTVGIDEVGRGCWAGPLCVAAVVLDDTRPIRGLTDSKLLTREQRETLAALIRRQSLAIGIGWVPALQLDKIGLAAALRVATAQALQQITIPYTKIIIDGTVKFSKDTRVEVMPRADLLVPAVSAASIIAKVARDRYMCAIDQCYGNYQFTRHVGYGTQLHRQLLEQFGPSPIHRKSFRPVQEWSL